MQSDLFVRILNISIISCYIIVVVMVLRALLLRGERKYVYLLWFVVLFVFVVVVLISIEKSAFIQLSTFFGFRFQ